jgi:hypothetical protein
MSHIRGMLEETTNGKSWNPVIKIVSDLRQVGSFLLFPPPIKLTAMNWNIAESGAKHHKQTNKH